MTTPLNPLQLADALTNPRRWHDLTDGECEQAAAHLRRLHARDLEWQEAAAWLASPAAVQRLAGYQDLSQRLQVAEQQRDELVAALNCVIAARRSEGGPAGGWIPKPATREYEQRLRLAWDRLYKAASQIEEQVSSALSVRNASAESQSANAAVLEQAAKAAKWAGLPIIQSEAGPQILEKRTPDGTECYGLWQPIEDPHQSMALSVSLGMKVYHRDARVIVDAVAPNGMPLIESLPYGQDPVQATRHAIFQMAVGIGKTIEEQKLPEPPQKGTICKVCQGTGLGSNGTHSRCICQY